MRRSTTRRSTIWGLASFIGLSAVIGAALLRGSPMTLPPLSPGDWGEALRAWVSGLGPLAPAGLIAFQILQILIAPIPGYPVPAVAGVLFGGFWGGSYSAAGMLIGAALAAGLTRRFGRPLVERLVARTDLRRWQPLLQNDSPWFWFLAIALPTGEIPYFLAGLTRVPISALLLSVLVARVPMTFVIASFASQALEVPGHLLWMAGLGLLLLVGFLYWRRDALVAWVTTQLVRASQSTVPEKNR